MTSRHILALWNGIQQPIRVICQKEDVSYKTVLTRVKAGHAIADAVRHARFNNLPYNGKGRRAAKYGKGLLCAQGRGVEKAPKPRKRRSAETISGEDALRERLEWCRQRGICYHGQIPTTKPHP